MKKINKICLASVATLILGSAILSSRAIAEDAIFTVRANAVIELTVPSLVNLNLYPTTGSDFNTASMDISVGTNNPTGYTLTMTADSDTLTRTGSITDGSNNTYTPTILPMLTTGSATGYTAAQFESSTTDAYTLNRWGYKLSTATNFMPMTTTTTELSTTNAPSNGDTVTLDFAAKVDTTKPAGTYQTTLNFNAVTNYVPISSIYDLEYMQQFAMLTNSERADVLSSMTTGQQYQLKDNRDEKPYYISKLADGNVWMTQNLDHDIVAQANYYTPANTDIPANWTASAATYSTSHTAWNFDTSTPESYDPGDYCWSGDLDDSTPVTCNQDGSHYHLGNYYNWTAAVAMNDTSSYTGFTNVDQSICPAGWTLPRDGGTNYETYENLLIQYGLDTSSHEMTSYYIEESPLYLTLSGYWYDGNINYLGSRTEYRSSVVENTNFAHGIYLGSDEKASQSWLFREQGDSVRCVARRPTMNNISDLEYMQDFAKLTSSEKTNVLTSMTTGQQYQLKDNRDEKTYYISKLADGNVWMTQNLDHDIIQSVDFYIPANTDIPSLWESWHPTRSTGDTTWSNTDIAQSYDPGDVCWDGVIMNNDGPVGTITCGNDRHYHLGNYYSLAAALAMETTISLQNYDYEIDQSICPAGWRLPAGGSENGSGSFSYLVSQSNITTGSDMINAPLYYVYGGSWQGRYLGSVGLYYSSMHRTNSGVYGLWISNPTYDPAISYGINFDKGVSVRCVAR